MKKNKIEILAPAGSYAAFQAALRAGADAVYAGGTKFSARAGAENFSEEEMIKAIREAHFYGCRLYLTVNTLLKENEIDELYDYILPFYKNGLDAVIVQDLGVVEYIRTCFPELDIHASTQMTVTGVYGAKFAESQGMTRVVPARELSLDEIRQIRKETELEIECFVHGALCYCYSGQCLLSSMIGGRSGNRGQCAQPCRLPYSFDNSRKYYLSPKDICTLEIIPELIEAGIDSFKIEGRMKKPEYVAGVTSLYRKYTDLYLKNGKEGFHVLPGDRRILMDLYNRGGSTTGYFLMHNGREMIALDRPNHAGVPALRVLYQKGREICAEVLTDIHAGDVIEITGEKNCHTFGNSVETGKRVNFLVRKGVRIPKAAVLNRIRNASLLQKIDREIIQKKVQIPVSGKLILKAGEPALLSLESEKAHCQVSSDEPVQTAQNSPMDRERIFSQMTKTGNSDFYFKKLDIDMDDKIFLPVRQLNLLRRKSLDNLKETICSSFKRTCPEHQTDCSFICCAPSTDADNKPVRREWNPVFSVYAETAEQLKAVAAYLSENPFPLTRIYLGSGLISGKFCSADSGSDARQEILRHFNRKKVETVIALPYIFRNKEKKLTMDILRAADVFAADGVLVRNVGEYELTKELGFDKKLILDHNLYVFNRCAKQFWKKLGVSEFCAPLELNEEELYQLGLEDCELEVYGRAPVMVSAQCVFKTSGKCSHNSDVSELTDRLGNRYPVRAFCDCCYNIIYNECPICLTERTSQITRLAPSLLRIRFSTETGEETAAVLERFRRTFSGRGNAEVLNSNQLTDKYTEGHFTGGVL